MTRNRDVANVLTAASSLATDTETAAAITTHTSAADPHTGYVLEAGGSTISVASGTTVPLKITNAGTGNSFLVEDSASTDSSPFLIDASGNVGVGSSSPSTFGKMAVVGGIYRVSESSGEEPIIVHSFGNGSYSSGMYSVNTFSGNFGNGLSFKTSDTSGSTAERVRISSAGRMLIGKTVDDTYNSFQLHTGFGLNGVGGYYSELNHNLIYSGGWKNAAQGPSSQIVMQGGASLVSAITFFTDPSSTSTAAGSASGALERMRITANGKLLFGNNSEPSNPYSVHITGGVMINQNTDISPSAGAAGQLTIGGNGYSGFVALDATAMHIGHNSGSRDLILATDETERLRVQAGGKVFLSAISRDTSNQVRNITLSTSSASGGNDGDVWLTYTA